MGYALYHCEIALSLSMSILLVRADFVILVVLNIFKIVPLRFLPSLLIANIGMLFLPFLKSFVSSFVKTGIYSIYSLKPVLTLFSLGFLNLINQRTLSLVLSLLCILWSRLKMESSYTYDCY